MSNYEQMSEAAKRAREEFLRYQARVWGYFGAIYKGLVEHCCVPQDHFVFLKWNGEEGPYSCFAAPERQPSEYTLPGAISYDSRDNTFNTGILIYLTPKNHFPRQQVTFALWIGESGNFPSVRIGVDGKPRSIALHTETARNVFCEQIAKEVIDAFSSTPTAKPKAIGFDVKSLTAPDPSSLTTQPIS